jgi:hypothetical protein
MTHDQLNIYKSEGGAHGKDNIYGRCIFSLGEDQLRAYNLRAHGTIFHVEKTAKRCTTQYKSKYYKVS